MTRYTANTLLATKISFINEMANLCERLGADINEVRRGIGHDPRIGFHFLSPGLGYGGSCLPKDVRAVLSMAEQQHSLSHVLMAVDVVNERQKDRLLIKLKEQLGDLRGRTIAVWGLAFKPRTDDIREAPALVLIRQTPGRGGHGPGPRSQGDGQRAPRLRGVHSVLRSDGGRPGRSRRPGHRDRVAGVPHAQLRDDAVPCCVGRSSWTAVIFTNRRKWSVWASPTAAFGTAPRPVPAELLTAQETEHRRHCPRAARRDRPGDSRRQRQREHQLLDNRQQHARRHRR